MGSLFRKHNKGKNSPLGHFLNCTTSASTDTATTSTMRAKAVFIFTCGRWQRKTEYAHSILPASDARTSVSIVDN